MEYGGADLGVLTTLCLDNFVMASSFVLRIVWPDFFAVLNVFLYIAVMAQSLLLNDVYRLLTSSISSLGNFELLETLFKLFGRRRPTSMLTLTHRHRTRGVTRSSTWRRGFPTRSTRSEGRGADVRPPRQPQHPQPRPQNRVWVSHKAQRPTRTVHQERRAQLRTSSIREEGEETGLSQREASGWWTRRWTRASSREATHNQNHRQRHLHHQPPRHWTWVSPCLVRKC